MKQLSILVLALSAALLSSCSHPSEVAPTSQNSLGMIVPSTSSASAKVLLLKDGSRANPTSGISGFSQMKIGSRLSIVFTPTGTVKDGVADVVVTKYGNAKDSTFIPRGPHTDSTSFFGTFSGVAYRSSADSSS